MKIRKHSINFKHIDRVAQYEPEVLDYIETLPKGEVFYDLGACLGYFSIYAKKHGLDVYSFEVEPKNYKGLTENIEINSMDIKIFNIGIFKGEKRMVKLSVGQDKIGGHHKTIDTDNFVGSHLIKKPKYKKIDILVNSLDNIVEEHDLPYPNHLKVDIDGSEYDFLFGAEKCLNYATSMMIEIYEHSELYGEIMNKITSKGFKLKEKYPIQQPNCVGCDGLSNYEFIKIEDIEKKKLT